MPQTWGLRLYPLKTFETTPCRFSAADRSAHEGFAEASLSSKEEGDVDFKAADFAF